MPNDQSLALPGSTPPPVHAGVRALAPNVELTDFMDPAVKQYEFEYYTPKQDNNDRIYLLRPGALAKGRSHFHDNMKSGVLCTSQYERSSDGRNEILIQKAKCCEWLGDPATRFAALVIHYATTKSGGLQQPLQVDLKVWRFGVDKYRQLQAINRDSPLTQHDLGIFCQEERFQRLQIVPKPEALLLHPAFEKTYPDELKRIEQWADVSVPKLAQQLGRQFPNDNELYKALVEAKVLTPGGGAGPAIVNQPGDAPISNFADIIGHAVPVPTNVTPAQAGPAALPTFTLPNS